MKEETRNWIERVRGLKGGNTIGSIDEIALSHLIQEIERLNEPVELPERKGQYYPDKAKPYGEELGKTEGFNNCLDQVTPLFHQKNERIAELEEKCFNDTMLAKKSGYEEGKKELQSELTALKKIISYETEEVKTARLKGLCSPQEYRDKLIESLQKELTALKGRVDEGKDMVRLILPMAKGYAYKNQVGNNMEMIQKAESFINPRQTGESEDS